MKKINFFASTIVAAFIIASCNSPEAPKEVVETVVDPVAEEVAYTIAVDSTSQVQWKGSMLGMYDHMGTLNFTAGTIKAQGGQLTGGEFTVDMTSITPTDNNFDPKAGKTPEKLKGHLSSADFFDVANHPTATFVVKSVNGNEATGTLTVRGTSAEETLKNIVVSESEGAVTASGTLTFNRKNYNVAFDMPVKDKVLSNDIELTISVKGSK